MLCSLKIAARLLIAFGFMIMIIGGLCGFAIYPGQVTQQTSGDVPRNIRNGTVGESIKTNLYKARFLVWKHLGSGTEYPPKLKQIKE